MFRISGQFFMIVMLPGPYSPFLFDAKVKRDSDKVNRKHRMGDISATGKLS